jgi:RNA polymerase sigma-70 factor (ECF subfamily)
MSKHGQLAGIGQKAAMAAVEVDINKSMTDRSGRSGKPSDAGDQERLTPAGFAARFEDAWPTLWYIAAAVLGDRSAADDVLQEAAMVALGKLSQFDPQTNFTAWMGKIVRFIALNHARRKNRTGTANIDPHALDIVVNRSSLPHSSLVNGRGELYSGARGENFDDRLLSALDALDETARACLLLRTLMDMPYRDISLALDIAEGTAMSHVHRARAVLRQRLASTDLRLQLDQKGHES